MQITFISKYENRVILGVEKIKLLPGNEMELTLPDHSYITIPAHAYEQIEILDNYSPNL